MQYIDESTDTFFQDGRIISTYFGHRLHIIPLLGAVIRGHDVYHYPKLNFLGTTEFKKLAVAGDLYADITNSGDFRNFTLFMFRTFGNIHIPAKNRIIEDIELGINSEIISKTVAIGPRALRWDFRGGPRPKFQRFAGRASAELNIDPFYRENYSGEESPFIVTDKRAIFKVDQIKEQ